MSSRPPNSDHDLFWYRFSFEECFGVSSFSSHWAGHHWSWYIIHFSSHVTIQLRNGSLLLHTIRENDFSKGCFFWFAVSWRGTHLSSVFSFPICFKCWKTVEWSTLSFGNFSCKRISFSDPLSWSATVLLIFKALMSFAKFLEPPLPCAFVSSSWAKCVVDVASYLCCFTTHFELKKENCSNSFFV